ncbi:hypothetical protein B0H14DRAFT_2582409 [Mycena olivaceomarginata]|nr:hypothetical protein B0H14DRAFT_2582409 [Mycena olivaceomarginata]
MQLPYINIRGNVLMRLRDVPCIELQAELNLQASAARMSLKVGLRTTKEPTLRDLYVTLAVLPEVGKEQTHIWNSRTDSVARGREMMVLQQLTTWSSSSSVMVWYMDPKQIAWIWQPVRHRDNKSACPQWPAIACISSTGSVGERAEA